MYNLHELTVNNKDALDGVNTQGPETPMHKQAFSKFLLVEEMSELTKEIIKIHARGKDDRWPEFYEELADVILVLDQVVRHANPVQLETALTKKIARFHERYGNGRS